MIVKTTLNKIRACDPCKSGWGKLLRHLGKTKADDEELALLTILESNGLNDALWCLRASDASEKDIRLFAIWCVRQVEYLMTDKRSKDALDVAERFANGNATEEEIEAAREVTQDATLAAWVAWSALSAARAAVSAAAWNTVWSALSAARAARDTVSEAAWAAVWNTARNASFAAAACSTYRETQETELSQKQKFIEMFCSE